MVYIALGPRLQSKALQEIKISNAQMSNEKNLGCLGYIGDYTTQL